MNYDHTDERGRRYRELGKGCIEFEPTVSINGANFDTLTEIYGRAVKNPALVPHWDALTAELVEGF